MVSASQLCWSGCRDSNSGPLVPQTSAQTKLRHSPYFCAGEPTQRPRNLRRRIRRSEQPADHLDRAPCQVHGNGADQQLEVPRRALLGKHLVSTRIDLAHGPGAGRARAVGVERGRREVLRTALAPRHALTVPLACCSRLPEYRRSDCSKSEAPRLLQSIRRIPLLRLQQTERRRAALSPASCGPAA